jgi:hypothetical protein
MTTAGIALTGSVHTGSCLAIPRALAEIAARMSGFLQEERREREYCLHDERGRPVGVIRCVPARPRVGRSAPSVYLHRAV